jgi:hypothetical protein
MGVREGDGGPEQRSSPSSIGAGSLSHLEQGSRVWSVEKPAAEEPRAQRVFEWVIQHVDWLYSRDLQPIHKTEGYCWRTPINDISTA